MGVMQTMLCWGMGNLGQFSPSSSAQCLHICISRVPTAVDISILCIALNAGETLFLCPQSRRDHYMYNLPCPCASEETYTPQ